METSDFDFLYQTFLLRLNETDMVHHRYLYKQINWANRIIGLKGASGVGKTTLVLQHIKEEVEDLQKVLYVSLDNLWFNAHDLMELVDYHYMHGGTLLVLDEIHRLPNWAVYVKNIYDNYPRLKLIYTGSSMLEIARYEADLGRRQRVYTLHGMSFREFLLFEGYQPGEAVALEDLLHNHQAIAMKVLPKDVRVLPLFEQYLHHGCYPFYLEEGDGFSSRLQETILRVLESDLPRVEDVSYFTIQKTIKMLLILAERVPFTPKMSELYRELETSREQGLKMLHWLEKAELLSLATAEVRNLRTLGKPDKILLNNPNLMYSLTTHIDKDTLRETFFYHQLSCLHEILLAKRGDFLIDHKYLFKIGGKGKSFEQISDEPNSFLAIDDIEKGMFNRIPLWMFGLLY